MNHVETIAKQLGGTRRLSAMTGAKNFLAHGSNALSFQLPRKKGYTKNGANYLKITLNSLDLYDIEMGKIWGTNYKVVETLKDIYGDQLKGVLEENLGLRLSL